MVIGCITICGHVNMLFLRQNLIFGSEQTGLFIRTLNFMNNMPIIFAENFPSRLK